MLSEIACRNAKPRDDGKALRLTDEKGMYLEVMPSGARYWRLKYRIEGAERRLALGIYPDTSLKQARQLRDDAKKLIGQGIDPVLHRKQCREEDERREQSSFEFLAREWFARMRHTWVEGHARTVISRLEQNIFPWLGTQYIDTIGAPELLEALRRIESRGARETAHRVLQVCNQVFRYAIACGHLRVNPAAELSRALAPTVKRSYAAITAPGQIAQLLRDIDAYQGYFVTRCALRLAPLVFVRPGELRMAQWSEIDLDHAVWRIPATRMKMRVEHIVPLSRQSIALLRELQPLTGQGIYLFPGMRSRHRPMSDNTVNAALRRLGYDKEAMTGHGFRHMASTVLNELGWRADAIERQLAHAERDNVRAAYNKAEYLGERIAMMQAWADYLDGLRTSTTAPSPAFHHAHTMLTPSKVVQ